MYDAPEAVHHLLNMVTEHIIAVYRYFRDTFEGTQMVSWPNYYMPRDFGVGMTEDLMPLVPPELYEQFALPHVNRIAREFGGIWIHYCGRFKPHWPTVRKFRNLRGIDSMYPETDPDEVTAAFPGIAHTMGLSARGQASLFAGQRDDAFQQRVKMILEHWGGTEQNRQNLTPPRMALSTKDRWARKKKMATGNIVTADTAIIRCHLAPKVASSAVAVRK
jgi:hypothetical protein